MFMFNGDLTHNLQEISGNYDESKQKEIRNYAGNGPLVVYQMIPHSAFFCNTPMSCSILPTDGLSIRCVKNN